VTESAPLVDPALIDRLIDTGQPFDLEARRGGLEETTGSAAGPSVYQRGGETATEYDFGNPTVNPLTGETSAGGATGTADAMAFFDGVTGLHYAAFGVGIGFILLAMWAAKRGRITNAVLCGAIGAGFVAGAFNPWLFLIAVAGLGAWLWLLFRSDLKRATEQAVLGKAAKVIEKAPNAGELKDAMAAEGMGDGPFRAVIRKAKQKEGV